MIRRDSVRLTRRFDRIERGLHACEADRRRAELRALFGAIRPAPVNASLLVFPSTPPSTIEASPSPMASRAAPAVPPVGAQGR